MGVTTSDSPIPAKKRYDRSQLLMHFLLPLIFSAILLGVPTPPNGGSNTPLLSQSRQEQITLEGILAQAVQSIGGRRELNSIESFQLHGSLRLPNGHPIVGIELSTSQGGKVLGVMTFINVGQSRFGSDGETAWEQNFNTDQTSTWTLINQVTLSQKVQQINWVEWFTMLPSRITDMHFEGSVIFDDEECWKIRIKEKKGRDQIAFFSCATHRPRGRRTIESTKDGDTIIDVYFRNWKRVGNLLFFHSIVFDRDGNQILMELDRIEIDNVSDDLFILPEPIKQLRDSS